jgi:hypothetical protein
MTRLKYTITGNQETDDKAEGFAILAEIQRLLSFPCISRPATVRWLDYLEERFEELADRYPILAKAGEGVAA